jgi:hypothetical protein
VGAVTTRGSDCIRQSRDRRSEDEHRQDPGQDSSHLGHDAHTRTVVGFQARDGSDVARGLASGLIRPRPATSLTARPANGLALPRRSTCASGPPSGDLLSGGRAGLSSPRKRATECKGTRRPRRVQEPGRPLATLAVSEPRRSDKAEVSGSSPLRPTLEHLVTDGSCL